MEIRWIPRIYTKIMFYCDYETFDILSVYVKHKHVCE